MNKKLFLLPIMAIVLILGGCSNSNRIDTSSLVQTITAENKSGKAVYNFYLLENSKDVQGVSVEADSLEKAVISAKPIALRWRFQSLNCILSTQISEKKLSKPILAIFQKKPQFHLWPILPFRIQKLCNFFQKIKMHWKKLKNTLFCWRIIITTFPWHLYPYSIILRVKTTAIWVFVILVPIKN